MVERQVSTYAGEEKENKDNQTGIDIASEFEELNNDLIRFLQFRGTNRETAEDISQDAWIKIIKKIQLYDKSKGSFKNWAFQISKNTLLDHFKKEKVYTNIFPTPDSEEQQIDFPDLFENVEETVVAKIEGEELRHRLSDLPDSQARVIWANHFDNLTQREISLRDNVPLGTVKNRERYGKKKLREVYQNEIIARRSS